ncbi:MAG: hypothetical protein AUG45_08800 [Ktedonobacter sp. 13_1_20CM_3_54_15]|nr:MAG: hypothetical protein AUG45_08800 [Ktedonobacter sp. 13_1_20CM_3_54_15]
MNCAARQSREKFIIFVNWQIWKSQDEEKNLFGSNKWQHDDVKRWSCVVGAMRRYIQEHQPHHFGNRDRRAV